MKRPLVRTLILGLAGLVTVASAATAKTDLTPYSGMKARPG